MMKKGVTSSNFQPRKQVQTNTVLDLLKSGLNPAKISKKYKIKMPLLSYHLRKLREKGIIKKVGYGTWEVKTSSIPQPRTPPQPEQDKVRGHAFIWKVKVPNEIREVYNKPQILKRRNIRFKLIGRLKFPRVIINNRKIWLGKRHIIIFEPQSFFHINSINSRKLAVYKLLETIKKIEYKLSINLEPYMFQPSREHYSLIKNQLAIQCNQKGEKIYVSDRNGLWLCIDNSYNLHELETLGRKSLVINKQLQDWWNSHKKTKFEVTPEFTLKMLNGLVATHTMEAQNIIKHQGVLDETAITLKEIRDAIDELRKEIKK